MATLGYVCVHRIRSSLALLRNSYWNCASNSNHGIRNWTRFCIELHRDMEGSAMTILHINSSILLRILLLELGSDRSEFEIDSAFCHWNSLASGGYEYQNSRSNAPISTEVVGYTEIPRMRCGAPFFCFDAPFQ